MRGKNNHIYNSMKDKRLQCQNSLTSIAMALTGDGLVAVNNFREYLKIESVHPKPDYDSCVYFLKKLAAEIQLKSTVINLDETHPILILTLEGTAPELPSILLNSHMDVVPVYKMTGCCAVGCTNRDSKGFLMKRFPRDPERRKQWEVKVIRANSYLCEEEWDHDPFGGIIDKDGNIFGRGAQDMKCVTIAQLEAIRRLNKKGIKLKRTLHMTILPDEEMGSAKGMAKFVEMKAFKKLNVGFDLDEGVPSFDNRIIIFKNERCAWRVYIHCPGTSGHGSIIHKNTAGEKLRIVLDKFLDFRMQEAEKLSNPEISTGEITTINLTSLEGGVQNNVVPPEFVVGFDIRIATEGNHNEMEKWIQDVCKAAGKDVYPEFLQKDSQAPFTSLKSNPFSTVVESTLKKMNLDYKMVNCFGATDARFARKTGVPALGLSPFLNTKWHFHANNEYMNSKEFLQGISYYETIIEALANV